MTFCQLKIQYKNMFGQPRIHEFHGVKPSLRSFYRDIDIEHIFKYLPPEKHSSKKQKYYIVYRIFYHF